MPRNPTRIPSRTRQMATYRGCVFLFLLLLRPSTSPPPTRALRRRHLSNLRSTYLETEAHSVCHESDRNNSSQSILRASSFLTERARADLLRRLVYFPPSLQQEQVDKAPTFIEMLPSFLAWMKKHGLEHLGDDKERDWLWVTDGVSRLAFLPW